MEAVEFPEITHWAIPFFVVTMMLEFVWARRSGALGYTTKDTLCSLSLGIGNLLVSLAGVQVYLWIMERLWTFRLFDLGTEPWAVALGVLFDDLRYYWQHRLGHELRWVWAAHVTHHSSERYNLSTALRQSWTTGFTGVIVLGMPMVLLGFHPKLLLFCASINLIYQYWVHTEAVQKTPRWFEYIFNTPSHHRVHHGKNPRYLDANYGGIFIFWDRLFGTFTPELEDEPVVYGLVKPLDSFNPVVAAFREWGALAKDATQGSLSLGARWRYLFGRPGWSHDGSRQTSVELKAASLQAQPAAEQS